jgi:hypothetical protein
MPTAIRATAAAPIAMPAIAPPPNLFEFDPPAEADVEVCEVAVVDVVVEDVDEGEVVADEDEVDVD